NASLRQNPDASRLRLRVVDLEEEEDVCREVLTDARRLGTAVSRVRLEHADRLQRWIRHDLVPDVETGHADVDRVVPAALPLGDDVTMRRSEHIGVGIA